MGGDNSVMVVYQRKKIQKKSSCDGFLFVGYFVGASVDLVCSKNVEKKKTVKKNVQKDPPFAQKKNPFL